MKLNLKILKAINEGIRKSLLSFDDIEFDKTSSNNTNREVTKSIKDWKWIHDNCVDLGLRSGTLWSKWNIGATNGDTPESWYGNYYAWGEIKPKKSYTQRTYHTYQYNNIPKELPLDHDVAFLKTKGFMCIPTMEQIEELMQLPNTWVTNYNGISGLNGRVFIGTNDNELFIPAAGFRYATDPVAGEGFYGLCWASNSFNTMYAYSARFEAVGDNIRYDPPEMGLVIRPVWHY